MITKSYNTYMSEKGIVILTTCIIVAFIAIFFFVLASVYHVKKGHAIVMEKMQEYYGIYQSGWYWFWPFLYHRVGYYNLKPTKQIRLSNGKKAEITYEIVDLKKYHYSKISVETFINKITIDKTNVDLEFLKVNLAQIGIILINIRPINC